jgi:hypothetical protein
MPETDATIDTTRGLLQSAAALQGLLTIVIVRAELLTRQLQDGMSVYHATEGWVGSETMTRALQDFERWRARWRVAVMRGWLAEGGTITEFAGTFGFSRQYAQRIAREARQTPDGWLRHDETHQELR